MTSGGRCFYDAIAVHLFPEGQEEATAGQITRGMIASYCLYLLVQRKQEYAEFVADECEAQRREYLYGLTENGQRVYGRALNDLSSFDIYVLDKLEAVSYTHLTLPTKQAV